ncbi:Flp pilus assembly protein CpaB [Sandaracinobacter sp. RS1-74]|uniref:Flp pilus assembly protein CpaB n=1 Tax=Sandaracinobacteroides sayramensis TaxID=2913411 RepID=UPI001EDA2872|nr:Flp pilus assembly protein CpaB [Sandaracinobacteroides sayramensis]MCG2840574.1 Flp pilus assembly protein CpaB [Sandaracinobacteroides sayramensis]
MRRSSIFLLVGAVLLGLMAVLGVKTMMGNAAKPVAEAPKTYAVVAGRALKFGEKLDAQALKLAPWPGTLPDGSYTEVRDAIADGSRTALRDIKEGELLLASAISGEVGRLASSTLLGPEMRAVSIPLDETSGAGGFVAPGDRVDIILTRQFGDEAAYAAAIIQGVRVLAVGQTQDTSASEPVLVKSATVEVTPNEAQKLVLAQKIGQIALALRPTGDEARVPVALTSANEAFGMRPPPTGGGASHASAPAVASGAPRVAADTSGTEVRVVRGTETTSYRVPR